MTRLASLLIAPLFLSGALCLTACTSDPDVPTEDAAPTEDVDGGSGGTVDLGPPVTEPGASARAYVEGARWVYLAADSDAMEELVDAQNASDVEAVRRLGREGKVIRVSNNTDVQVVSTTPLLTEVRITEDGLALTGSEGWLQRGFVRAPTAPTRTGLPEYVVLDKVGSYLDVLVPALTVEATAEELAPVARGIADAENVDQVSLYSTEDAFRVNFSSSFSDRNPDALADGYLGMWDDGTFQPSPYRER